VDKQQDDSSRITAIRETFEESGLLIASTVSDASTSLSDQVLDEARRNIHEQWLRFRTFLAEHHLKADTDSLLPFTQWITPPNALR
jgi:8-oxo-dGTP pyrophosphatase MutT (NUDIX family)